MKFLVTAKRVTDPEMKIKVKPDGSGIELSGMSFKVNPFDEIAIEEALRLKEKHGGEVVVVSLGSSDAATEIRSGLAMGADRGILVQTDETLDSFVVSAVFKKIVEQESPDVVLMGKQAVDDDANQAGQMLAERLGWGQACFASKVEIDGTTATVAREVDGGIETVAVSLPAVITTDLRLNEPRYASLPNIMKAKKKPLAEVALASLGVDLAPKVKVIKIEEPKGRTGSCKFVKTADELFAALRNEAKVL